MNPLLPDNDAATSSGINQAMTIVDQLRAAA
jgi:hypothetical protein